MSATLAMVLASLAFVAGWVAARLRRVRRGSSFETRPSAAPQDEVFETRPWDENGVAARLAGLERELGLPPSEMPFWAEAFVNGLGWVLRPTDRLTALGAALCGPVRAASAGDPAAGRDRAGAA